MNKSQFTDLMKVWIESYLQNKYGKSYHVSVVIPTSNISRLPRTEIKDCVTNYSSFEFSPDIIGILKHKTLTNKVELVFLNRSMASISLKEIGEMQCYCRIADPLEAFIVSSKGLPQEINMLLLDDVISTSLLKYSSNKFINVFTWNATKGDIEPLSIFPLGSNFIKGC